MTPEQLVLTYLRGEGADVADAEWALDEIGFAGNRLHEERLILSTRALLIVAAISIGFTFKARDKLAPACEYKGRAAIGGTEAEPTSSDPWWCLVNFVEAAQ